jgi:hypothetical protein
LLLAGVDCLQPPDFVADRERLADVDEDVPVLTVAKAVDDLRSRATCEPGPAGISRRTVILALRPFTTKRGSSSTASPGLIIRLS